MPQQPTDGNSELHERQRCTREPPNDQGAKLEENSRDCFDCCQASYPNYLELLESRESRESRTPDLDLDLESLMYVSREL